MKNKGMLSLQLASYLFYIDNSFFPVMFASWPAFSIPWIVLLLCYNFRHCSHLCSINVRFAAFFFMRDELCLSYAFFFIVS